MCLQIRNNTPCKLPVNWLAGNLQHLLNSHCTSHRTSDIVHISSRLLFFVPHLIIGKLAVCGIDSDSLF